jgi:hypothetical protein
LDGFSTHSGEYRLEAHLEGDRSDNPGWLPCTLHFES